MTDLTADEIQEGLVQAFSESLLPLELPVPDNLQLSDIDGVDSVSRVRLFMCIEERFGIAIKTREGGAIRTFRDIQNLVASKLGKV